MKNTPPKGWITYDEACELIKTFKPRISLAVRTGELVGGTMIVDGKQIKCVSEESARKYAKHIAVGRAARLADKVSRWRNVV